MSISAAPLPLAAGDQALRPGRLVFDRYRLEKVAGRGGMGIVWRAFDTKLERIVALKFLPDLFFMDAAARDDLKRETRRSLDLTHPHIVRIHDFVENDEAAAICMEYIDGATLSQRRIEQPSRYFECEALHGWTKALCQALDYAHHTACCVHRDLKPSNLMVTSRGLLKVADFGISCGLQNTAARVSAFTSTGGTLGYMSPQQLAGELASPSDDIYSVGATLYELLTGKPPFHSGDLNFQIRTAAPEKIAERRRQLGAGGRPIDPVWEETILACLAKDPAARPADVLEVAARLGLGGFASAATRAPQPESAVTMKHLPPRPSRSAELLKNLERSARKTAVRLRASAQTAYAHSRAWASRHRQDLSYVGIALAFVAVWFRPRGHDAAEPVAPAVAIAAPALPPAAAVSPVTAAPVAEPSAVAAPAPSDRDYLALPAPAAALALEPAPPVLEAVSPAPPEPEPALTAKLQVSTTPAAIPFRVLRGAYETATPEVLATGVTPLLVENLPAGPCRVELTPEGQGASSFSLLLAEGAITPIERTLPHGTVKFQSTPAGAEIYDDEQLLGTAPLELPILPGPHKFHAEAGDAESKPQAVTVALDGSHTVSFDFRTAKASTPRRSHAKAPKPEPSTLAKISRSITSVFTKSPKPRR